MVYLDYAANTKVDDEVLDYFFDITKKYYGNPNSNHELGYKSKELIDEATENISKLLNVKQNEIIYTSGATESNNLVIQGILNRYKNYGKHVLLSSLEHNSIITPATMMQEQGFNVEIIPVDKNGLINIDTLKKMIKDDTILVSITSVDSELGIIQPIEEIASLIKQYPNTYFHTDASQSIGKINIDYSNVDLITITPHKFYGLNDIGILIKRENVSLKPIIYGGKSTTIYRSGTPNTASIASTSKALEKALKNIEERYNYVSKLNKEIKEFLSNYSCVHLNSTDKSIPYIINFSVDKINSNDLVKLLNDNDIYVSAKTSCCPISTPSKIVYAKTKDKNLSLKSIRLSLSHLTTKDELDEFKKVFDKVIKEL